MQDSKIPALTAVLAVFVNIILNLTLIWFMGTTGLALSTAICSYLQVCVLVLILRKRFQHSILDGLPAALTKTLLATALMSLIAIAILMLCRTLPGTRAFNIIRIAAVVPVSTVVYVVAAKFLHIEMLSLLTSRTNSSPDT
jgi:putative peptidoglycan lipid II flippase